jgi:hypothetical protein
MTPAAVLAFPETDPLDRLAATANAAHVEGCREFLRHAIIAGQALLEAKKIVKGAGGSWALWVRENCHFSERTAQVYMQLARDPQRAADSLRQALRQGFCDKKRPTDKINQIDHRGDPADAYLCVSSCAELFAQFFAAGIQPDAVITEPPHGPEHLHLFSELALACAAVPHVIVRMDRSCLYLPWVLQRLCERLTWRGSVIRDNRQILVFCQDDDAFERAKGRARALSDALRPWSWYRPCESWEQFFIQRLTEPGAVLCDPFLRPETAIAALEFGRRFVGCNVNAGVVAYTRRRIGAER